MKRLFSTCYFLSLLFLSLPMEASESITKQDANEASSNPSQSHHLLSSAVSIAKKAAKPIQKIIPQCAQPKQPMDCAALAADSSSDDTTNSERHSADSDSNSDVQSATSDSLPTTSKPAQPKLTRSSSERPTLADAKGAATRAAWKAGPKKAPTSKRSSLSLNSSTSASSPVHSSHSNAGNSLLASTGSATAAAAAAPASGLSALSGATAALNASAMNPANEGPAVSALSLRTPALLSNPANAALIDRAGVVPPLVVDAPAPAASPAIALFAPRISSVLSFEGQQVSDRIRSIIDRPTTKTSHPLSELRDLKRAIEALSDNDRALLTEDIFFNNWNVLQAVVLSNESLNLPGSARTFSRDGKFAIIESSGRPWLVNLTDPCNPQSLWFKSSIKNFEKIALSSNGTRVLAAAKDGNSPTYWRLVTPSRRVTANNDHSCTYLHALINSPITCLTLSGDGTYGLTGHVNGEVRHWNFETLASTVIADHGGSASDVILSDNGDCAVTCGNGRAYYHTGLTVAHINTTRLNHNLVTRIAMTPSGSHCLTAASDLTVHYWDRNNLSNSKTLLSGIITQDMALSSNGKRVGIAFGTVVQVIDFTDPSNEIRCELKHDSYITKIRLSQDGKHCMVHRSNNGKFCTGINKIRAVDCVDLWNISRPQAALNHAGNHNTPHVLVHRPIFSIDYVELDASGQHVVIDGIMYPLAHSDSLSLWHMVLIVLGKKFDDGKLEVTQKHYYLNEFKQINDAATKKAVVEYFDRYITIPCTIQ